MILSLNSNTLRNLDWYVVIPVNFPPLPSVTLEHWIHCLLISILCTRKDLNLLLFVEGRPRT